jgi:hypothetical protein
MQRLLLRGGAVAIVVVTFIAAGLVGATAIRAKVDDAANRANENESSRRAARAAVSSPATASDSDDGAASTRAPMVTASMAGAAAARTSTSASSAASRQPAAAPRGAAPVNPAIAMGRTDLPDSVVALRGDTDVVVSFDVPMVRTRRPDKFEQFVRTTLPLIYGGAAREALSKIPQGGLASQGDLLAELPRKGMRIPLGYEWAIRLFPETRPGQDGPIVVRYRASVVPAGR